MLRLYFVSLALRCAVVYRRRRWIYVAAKVNSKCSLLCVPIRKSGEMKGDKEENGYVSFTAIYVAPFDSWRTER